MTKEEFTMKVCSLANEFAGNQTYSYWVYCGSKIKENHKSNENAVKTIALLEHIWEMNADANGHYAGPEFVVKEDEHNLEIQAVSKDLNTLIYGCMCFAQRKSVIDHERV